MDDRTPTNNHNASLHSDPLGSTDKPSPYDLLMRQSRKIGSVATRSYNLVASLLSIPVDKKNGSSTQQLEKSKRLSLNYIVKQSHDILAEAQTVILPTNLFPDTVIVDRMKVSIIQRTFFWSSQNISIRIEDILNVSTSVGPLFGSLTISSRVMNSTDHYEINYFWRKDAIHLKQIIQGYMIAVHNRIDTSVLETEELIEKLSELGNNPT